MQLKLTMQSRKENRIRQRAYEIFKTNQELGIKTDSISDWCRATQQIEEEDMRELRKHIENLKETWL